MDWWTARNPAARLSFTYVTNTVSTVYEPITCYADPANGADPCTETDWVHDVMANLGYPGSDIYQQVYDYDNAMRTANGTDWSFTIFVADSFNDADGEFPDGYFAYTYLGGPNMVMTYDNGGYGIGNFQAVAAHELGHIFYAMDEYSESNCATGDTSGYLNAANTNCQNGGTAFSCIMRGQTEPYNTPAICSATRKALGWLDTNSNGVPDIADLPPTTALTPYSPDPTSDDTLAYSGTAYSTSAHTNSNPYSDATSHYYYQPARYNISVLKIAGAEYNVDGGTWRQASPGDGSFGQTTEGFTFTTTALAGGTRVIRARAKDNFANYDPAPPSDSLLINTSQPTDMQYVNDSTGTDTDYVSSLSALSANWGASTYSGSADNIDHYEYAIGTTQGGRNIADWTSTGPGRIQSVTRAGLSLTEGTIYYFSVRAAALPGPVYSGTAVSDGQRVDVTSPTARVEITSALPAKTGTLALKLITTETNGFKNTPGNPGLTFTPAGGSPQRVALAYLASSTWTGTAYIESYYSTGTASFAFTGADQAGNSGSALTSGGTFLINTAISGASGGIVANSDNDSVTVPAGAYPGDLIISISTVPSSRTSRADAAASEAHALRSTDTAREFTARTPAGTPVTSFSAPLTIKLCYPDADNDGMIDRPDYLPDNLARLYLLDESASKWTRIGEAKPDLKGNCLSAGVSHFSVYSVRAADASQLGMANLKAFPNPCYFDRAPGVLTIRGLPADADNPRIFIYNTAGELVRTLKPGDGIDDFKEAAWNGREKGGAKAASGLYLYLVKTENYGKATGKFYVFW
jgi:hypothetical protein